MQSWIFRPKALKNLLHAICAQGSSSGTQGWVCHRAHKANGAVHVSLKAQSCFLLHLVSVNLRGARRYPKPCQRWNVWAVWICHTIPSGHNGPDLLNGDLPPLHLGWGQELTPGLVRVGLRLAQDQIRFNALRIATGADPLLKQLLSILMQSAAPHKTVFSSLS